MSLSVRLFGNRVRAQELIGEAKRQMVLLKRFMGFGNLSQLEPQPIRLFDGSTIRVRSFFGIDIVEIIGAGAPIDKIGEELEKVYLVFLIVGQTEYAVWRITHKDASLTSARFDISKYTTYFNIYANRSPSVVKSYKNKEHVYTIENIRVDIKYFYPTTGNTFPHYGRRVRSYLLPSGDKDVVIGVRNCFIGGNFDYDVSYIDYSPTDISNYILSGRHSSYIDEDEGLVTDLSLWKINATSGQIKYKSIGVQKDGAVISYAKSNDIYAVLSKDKFIGVDLNSYVSVDDKRYKDNQCPEICGDSPSLYYQDSGDKYDYLFGSVTLEHWLGYYAKIRTANFHKITCPYAGSICLAGDTCLRQKISLIYDLGQVKMLDYDNINIDESFVAIYGFFQTGVAYRDHMGNYCGGAAFWDAAFKPIYWHDAETTDYKLVYRTNNGSLKTITICTSFGGTKYDATIYCGSGGCARWSQFSLGTIYEGERLSGVSCQATEKYLFYTYTIWTYTGPDNESHFDDEDNDEFTFSKRIIGIIDIKTNERTEHIIDDTLLGDLYKDTFDKEKISAIGLHILEK